MNEFENHCEFNLAETCVHSFTVDELLEIAGATESILGDLLPLKLTYGAINGSVRLRDNIANLYTGLSRDNVMVTHGAIGANALVYQALVEPGDRVVSVVPTYQQHTSIPESMGADVTKVPLREEQDFRLDLDELRSAVGTNTKLIAITNPNNPTGSLMTKEELATVAEIASISDAFVLCDEVYRGTDQTGSGTTVSVAELYDKGISTASMSKAFSLAGLRLGWVAGPAKIMEAVSHHRDYNTISVGMIDDLFASIALEAKDAILERNRGIVRRNLAILDEWVTTQPAVEYVKPQSGTTAMLRYDADIKSRDLCEQILRYTGVLLAPGSAFDMEGYLRIGYANDTQTITDGLAHLGKFLTAAWQSAEPGKYKRLSDPD